ncbi:single-stranded DNA-binding protein [Panacibacter ginsenosidivorans]|uniref:Single-stranded DNA-binding protein n=1 Tax=Panacibacter ginsenosidivorans TaxID=1813871 RepID=A0A5B8VGC6_9BACT|nr:single-stranded DNA-binding protein [Panacibacter ginsenosidivorans]QEC69358.1 single-stranded DNA-binding protein [Panacibacter ginsenosidivorans]
MKTQNKIQLIGYVGKDPVISTASNGSKLARMRIATDRFFKDENNKPVKQTAWHNILAWEKKADFAENNFLKGSHILIEGRIRYRNYKDKNGEPRHIAEIIAEMLMNLDR